MSETRMWLRSTRYRAGRYDSTRFSPPSRGIRKRRETGEDSRLVDYHLQDPSLLNWFGLAQAVRDNPIYDFPICNKSFDLSYCGNDL